MDEQKIRKLTRSCSDQYYTKVFGQIKNHNVSWNWGAFFGTFHWMIYRKMFAPAFLCFCLIVWPFIFSSLFTFILTYVVTMVACGLFGNFMYLKYAERRIKRQYYLCGYDYKPTCQFALFTQIFFLYPIFISLLVVLDKYLRWGAESSNIFNSGAEMFKAYATLNPNDYEELISMSFSCLLMFLFQFVIVPAFFCIKDMIRVKKAKEDADNPEVEINEENLLAVVSVKSDEYYLRQFKKIERGSIVSVNFAACFWGGFLGLFWFLYRKMYGIAAVLIAAAVPYFIAVRFDLISLALDNVLFYLSIAADLLLLLGGANHLYYKHIKYHAGEDRSRGSRKYFI